MPTKPGKPLSAPDLYRFCDPKQLRFESTEDLEDFSKIPGQDRAMKAIHFATEIDVDGHNVFVLGPTGAGRHAFVRQFLEGRAAGCEVPSDWCYVYNFEDSRKPRALELPPGTSKEFCLDVENAIQDAQTAIPGAFESEDFQLQNESIAEEFKEQEEKAFKVIEKAAKDLNIGVIQTPRGIAFIPMRGDEALKSEEFEELPEKKQKKFRDDINNLTERLQRMMRSAPKRAREVRQKLRQLEHDVARLAVTGLVDELKQKYQDIPAVLEHLERMQDDIIDNVSLFLSPSEGAGFSIPMKETMQPKESPAMQRYAINVLVDRSECKGAPVVFEDNPSFAELIGKIEHRSEFGTLVTNFSLIRPGALHWSNGGYLVLDVAKVLSYPLAWEGLKRALKSRELRIRALGDDVGLFSTVSLEPQPIPLDLKVILIGERHHYYLLGRYDPEFPELFKIAADFEDEIARNEQSVEHLARFLATFARRERLKHLDRGGIARLMEESARHSGDRDWLSADIRQTTDIMREAHYWAGQTGKKLIGAEHVQQAIEARIDRASRYRDRMQDEILRNTMVVETSGARVGQVNGLAVIQLGGFSFARPQRISATVALGSGKVIDIEREVKLGGPIHSKGILILAGFLRSHYATGLPMSLSASLVFEQSYGGVEGDSASAGELCALLSALAEIPIKQSLAVTGSLDQHGRIQAIGGVNEKIEGFFDICCKRGLSGDQGVLIPISNVRHLMLRSDVIQAVKAEQFHVYPIDRVDCCLELLTGKPAGKRNRSGEFPKNSVNRKISQRLLDFANQVHAFRRAGHIEDE